MELSIFLAKLIGLAFLIIGIALFSRPEDFQNTVKDVSKSNAIMTLISIMPLVAGISIIISHNTWDKDWTVVVTIIGWLIFVIGIFRLFFHKEVMKVMARNYTNKTLFVIAGIILFIIGAYLSGKGFFGDRFL